MKINPKLSYESFTNIERANLSLAAMARKDIEEIKKLRASCPKDTYITLNLEYMALTNSITQIMHSFAIQHLNLYYKYLLLDICTCILQIKEAEKDNSKIADKLIRDTKECENGALFYLTELKSLYEGFKAFCLQTGIDYQNAIDSIKLLLDKSSTIIKDEQFIIIKPDINLIDNIKKEFFDLWITK